MKTATSSSTFEIGTIAGIQVAYGDNVVVKVATGTTSDAFRTSVKGMLLAYEKISSN